MGLSSFKSNHENAALGTLEDMIWSLLAEGVRDAKNPFHTPGFATFGDKGPEVRTVVLRHADPNMRQISCHTDWRPSKRGEIEIDERVSWLFYNRERKTQLRLGGRATPHKGGVVTQKRWERSSPGSRGYFHQLQSPGTPVEEPLVTPKNPESGYPNFTVLMCTVDIMDWLFLGATGHRRAVLLRQQGAWAAKWVAP